MSHITNITRIGHATNQNNVQLKNVTQASDDKRLTPKYRRHQELWQYYLMWQELVEMRKRHTLRIASIKAGKSNMRLDIEQGAIEAFELDRHIQSKRRRTEKFSNLSYFALMIAAGEKVGPIWDWLINHKGIAESMAAQILALINDIGEFDTIAKLWRYSGYGIYEYWVDENGKAQCPREGWKWHEIGRNKERYRVWTIVDHARNVTQNRNVNNNGNSHETDVTHQQYAIPQNIGLPLLERVDYIEPEPNWTLKKLSDRNVPGYHSPFNRKLKAVLWNLSESFRKQQTPYYVDIYYAEKERLRTLHPEKKKVNGKWKWNDGHIDAMALRKMRKEFLKQLWLKWREFEGLPLSEEY